MSEVNEQNEMSTLISNRECHGHGARTHTRMSEAVSRQVVTLNKPHVTHGASKRFHT